MTTQKNAILAGAIGLAAFFLATVAAPAYAIDVQTPLLNSEDVNATTTVNEQVEIALDGSSDVLLLDGFWYSITQQPTNGTLSDFNAGDGMVTYTPDTGFVGLDSFQYEVIKKLNIVVTFFFHSKPDGTVYVNVNSPICTDGYELNEAGNECVAIPPKQSSNFTVVNMAMPAFMVIKDNIPESTTGVSLYDVTNGPLGGNLMTAMRLATMGGVEWSSLTEGQQIWMIENINALVEASGN